MTTATQFLEMEVSQNGDSTYSYAKDNQTDEEIEQNILANTHKEIENFYTSFSQNTESFSNDLIFLYIDQWDPNLRTIRKQKYKTVLQVNYLKSMVDKICGEESEVDPDFILSPPVSTEDYDKEVDMRAGILRQEMYENNFSAVKSDAFRYGVSGGYGAMLCTYDYKNPKTYDKKLIFMSMEDPTSCFWSADAKLKTKADSKICGYFISMPVPEFHLTFPNATSTLSWMTVGNNNQIRQEWKDGPRVRIANVWRREKYTDTVVLLSNGESMVRSKAEKYLKTQDSQLRKLKSKAKKGFYVDPKLLQKIEIVREDERVCDKIMHYKMIADEILEQCEWPSDKMPLVFVDCQSFYSCGIQYTQSWHKHLQDRQRQLNYMASAECDFLIQAHQGNWLGTPKNFDEKVLKQWLMPQVPNGILIANYDDKSGLPQYVSPPQPSAGFSNQQQSSIRDIYNMSGYHDANLGMNAKEQNGVAINRRTQNGNMSSFMPFQNLQDAIEEIGRVALSLMPCVFDNTRQAISRTKDGKSIRVLLNEPYTDEFGEEAYRNDMSQEGFGFHIQVGASFAAQKEAQMNTFMEFLRAAPQLGPLIYDRVIKNMDIDDTSEMIDRVQKFLVGYPVQAILSQETGIKPPPPPPPSPEQQQAQSQMMLNQQKVKNESDKIALQSQQMVQDAINDHARNVIDLKKFNDELTADHMKAQAELGKAMMDSTHDKMADMYKFHIGRLDNLRGPPKSKNF